MATVKCWKCNGSGSMVHAVYVGRVYCTVCKGTGKLSDEVKP